MMKTEKLMKRDPIMEFNGPKNGNMRANNHSKHPMGIRTAILLR
jgi:hypothetical protein